MPTSNTIQPSGNWLERFESNAEFDRFSIISVAFLLIGCLGGITVGVFANEHIWQIGVIAGATMLSLSLMLAVAPMKWIIRTTLLTLLIDVLFIVLSFF